MLRSLAQKVPRTTTTPLQPATRVLLPSSSQLARTMYQKKTVPAKHWTKQEVDERVTELLFQYAHVNPKQVILEANLQTDLLFNRLDRFSLYWDTLTSFEFSENNTAYMPPRRFSRDFKSGREAADWAASFLEEEGRLIM
ncbi:hypothetical protein HK097_000450 [Rhizophlyctis rosea]|uniref:Uncharacterized protein n=1 Tax=Rhizophlyctis rosea TaxID=64517 RepID=A0AAD5X1F5_9FUNG|nr:hypothetical protein HK097_000450 [Rhizophlyctis rosea]